MAGAVRTRKGPDRGCLAGAYRWRRDQKIEHIGATSVPGLAAEPWLDIMISVWPFPLPPESLAALEELGYTRHLKHDAEGEQVFTRGTEVHLHAVEAGGERGTEHLLLRDYLRANTQAMLDYDKAKRNLATVHAAQRDRYQKEKAPILARLMEEAGRWYRQEVRFAPLQEALKELQGFHRPFIVSSGWAIDLHLGHVTRVHHDIDITLYRSDQLELQAYMTERGWIFLAPHDGHFEPWPQHMRLELPRHQVHAHKEGRLIDFLLGEVNGNIWRFRRHPAIIRTLDRLRLWTEEGIAYLAPEVVLLYKSSHADSDPRGKDQADFDAVVEQLEPERKAWLRWALTVYKPGHPWHERLG